MPQKYPETPPDFGGFGGSFPGWRTRSPSVPPRLFRGQGGATRARGCHEGKGVPRGQGGARLLIGKRGQEGEKRARGREEGKRVPRGQEGARLLIGKRAGTRYRSDYLTNPIQYVHLNPGRAGMVDGSGKRILDYQWGSLAQWYAVAPSRRAND